MKATRTPGQAALKALPVTILTGIMAAVILVEHALTGDRPLIVGVFVSFGLTLVVFLTYFFLALCGYKVDAHGTVKVPRRYSWPLVLVVIVIIMAAALYLADLWK
jgi:hypothetical protein